MSAYTTTHHIAGGKTTGVHRSTRRCRRSPGQRAISTLITCEWGAVLVVAAALVATLLWLAAGASPGSVPTHPVRVEAGDSLWRIATAHPVAGLTTEQTVELIRQANGIDGSTLHAGQLLHVPDAAPGTPAVAQR